jgi:hypothetical protein
MLAEFPSHIAYGIPDYSLAVSGDVFRWIIDFAPLDVLERVTLKVTSIEVNGRCLSRARYSHECHLTRNMN